MTWLRQRLAALLGADGGYVAVFVALCIPLLVGMCALAVDVASWHVAGVKVQKAADAAALGGTIYLPTSQSTAISTATELAAKNGFSSANGDTVTVSRTLKPTQLRVTITTTVANSFGMIFGKDQTRITRTAVADYAGPIPMGSPCNIFGNQDMEKASFPGANPVPDSECSGSAGNYWVNVAGTNTNKARGDGYSSGYCTNPDPAPTIDRCTPGSVGAGSPTGPTTNVDYNENKDPNTGLDVGYLYAVRVTQAGITLDIQGYDIEWAAQGDGCELSTMDNATSAVNDFVPTAAEAGQRYQAGKSVFCSGDSSMDQPEGDGLGARPPSTVRTLINVYAPSLTPWNPLSAPLRCSLDLPGWDETSQFSELLDRGPSYDPALARYFHRWESLCRVNGAQVGDYIVQIRTVGGGGQNRFSLRTDAGAASRQVSMFALGKTSYYNSVPAGRSTFYLARLDSGAAGKTLNVDFFDLADAERSVDVTVLAPDSDAPFSNCRAAGPPIVDTDQGTAISDCTITATNAGNNGRWIRVKVPVPAGYTCSNDADPSTCWVRVRLSTSGDQNDTTTWRASLEGDPVRIVE